LSLSPPLIVAIANAHAEESLLIIRGLGIQTSSTSPSYLSTPTVQFIPTTSIQDILIHEAFIGFEVRFYLAVVVKGEQDVVVVFPKLLPKRAMLETVWRGSRACLWGDAKAKAKTEAEAEAKGEDGN
jgi:phosphatidylinositol glycan class H protein